MKSYYVYELVNLMGTVEYAGHTNNSKRRFREHTKSKSHKFYGRQDLSLHVISVYSTRIEARRKEIELQKFWGFQTEDEIRGNSRTGKFLGSKNGNSKLTEEQVIQIKTLLSMGVSCSEIGRRFNTGQPAISYIKNGRLWSHITI